MEKKQLIGLIGSVALMIGVFVPSFNIPNTIYSPSYNNGSYFNNNGGGGGVIILILAATSLILVLTKNYKVLFATSFPSLGLILLRFMDLNTNIFRRNLDLSDWYRIKEVDVANQSYYWFQWGWGLLIFGVALLIASAIIDTIDIKRENI